MSLWLESLSSCLYDTGDDPELRAKCILSHLSMAVPRSWWERALETNNMPDSYAHILDDLRKELLIVPELVGRIQFNLLVALAFADDDTEKKEPRFDTDDSQYSIEQYLDRAGEILIARPELGQLGRLIDNILLGMKMEESEKLKLIYKEAYNFLKKKVSEDILKKHLDYYHHCNPKSIPDVFKQMIQTLKNKQGYVNFIADIAYMSDILHEYDPQKVTRKFGNKWEILFKEFKKEFGKNYKMDISNKRNAWVMYSKGVLSCATFLSNFKSLDKFDEFVKSFFLNEFTIAALPMLLEKEIFGFGFPLACDFIKELGYYHYGKPDVHLKDIFMELKLVDSNSDYEIFKKIVKIGLIVKQDPVIVDKIFWLIGSGKFHFSDISIGSQKGEFIEFLKKKYITFH